MKRRAGDRWCLMAIDPETRELRQVGFGYWDDSWPYRSQAEDHLRQLRERGDNGLYRVHYEGNFLREPTTRPAEPIVPKDKRVICVERMVDGKVEYVPLARQKDYAEWNGCFTLIG